MSIMIVDEWASSVCRNSIPMGKSLHLSFLSRFEASTPLSLLSLHHVEALILQFWNESITRAVFNMVLNSLVLCPSLELFDEALPYMVVL
jgi:hypothetical protein